MDTENSNKLMIVWTSRNRETALNMILMYGLNAKKQGWFEQVNLMLWGPSQKLFISDPEIKEEVKKLKAAGVRLLACIACAERYKLTEKLLSEGIEVYGMGPVLTKWLKSEGKIITI